MAKVLASTFLHSTKVHRLQHGGNAVVVSELQHLDDGTTRPALVTHMNPKRSFWTTKIPYRTHDEKRVIEDVNKLDRHVVEDSRLDEEIFRALNGYYPKGRVSRDKLYDSPYLYGANIDIQTLIKAKSNQVRDAAKIDMAVPTVGFLDIERSIDKATMDEITIISVTHENQVYTAINKFFFHKVEGDKRIPGDLRELSDLSHSVLDPLIDQMFKENKYLPLHKGRLPFKFHYFVGSEIECIKWIFDCIKKNKTSFVGIWNMDFDIPAIIQAIEKHGEDPAEIFCDDSLPKDCKVFKYKRDEKVVAHPTEKWHWLHCSGYTQYYDAMCLYAKLRTVKGKESSYALDNILKSNNLEGKLKFPEIESMNSLSKENWHREMTRSQFYRYIIYNQADVVWIQLMEWLNTDALSMCMLSGVSALEKFPRQTKKVQDTLFVDWVPRGYILGTTAQDMTSEIDDEIGATGGAVLDPNRTEECGLFCVKEAPNQRTRITAHNNDVDFSAMYPTTEMAGNIGTDTKLSTVVAIYGDSLQRYYTPSEAVEKVFGYIVSPYDNALHIGTKIFGLPNISELEDLFDRHLSGENVFALAA